MDRLVSWEFGFFALLLAALTHASLPHAPAPPPHFFFLLCIVQFKTLSTSQGNAAAALLDLPASTMISSFLYKPPCLRYYGNAKRTKTADAAQVAALEATFGELLP